ncbi:hypothetical protein [Haloarchaeobius sp. HME9146]|uniref:hypothetical protein n=1 Tax=Haloarchaeobius sp. HME9146 TaxID=2978732 RepID=UPI0021C23B2A|nr:hypothetical protein [Haloarchaeobius sp. HME9146]MCT9095271.1 hypothetical protein [Haloarchaeobius sp. HME9146]
MSSAEGPEEDVEEIDEDQPEMEPDEMADVDLDALADEVEADAGATADEDDQPETTPEPAEPTTSDSGDSWGDMYVGTLTGISNALIDEYGTEDAEHVDEQRARDLHLDEYFDEWMASRGKSDMPPEQALILSSAMFMAVVVGTKTELPSKLLEEADF